GGGGRADRRVEQREDGAEQPERRVAERPLTANAFADPADDLAVEEVHQVDREEHDERVRGSGHRPAPSPQRPQSPAPSPDPSSYSRYFPASITASAIRRRAAIGWIGALETSFCTPQASEASAPRAESAATTCFAAAVTLSAASFA